MTIRKFADFGEIAPGQVLRVSDDGSKVVSDALESVRLKAPDGTLFELKVSNLGILTAAAVQESLPGKKASGK